jgi:hypothetical protein
MNTDATRQHDFEGTRRINFSIIHTALGKMSVDIDRNDDLAWDMMGVDNAGLSNRQDPFGG